MHLLIILVLFPFTLLAQGLDDEFLETLRAKDNIPREHEDNTFAVDYGNTLIEFDRLSGGETTKHQKTDRLVVRVRHAAPQLLKPYMESYSMGSQQYNNTLKTSLNGSPLSRQSVDVRAFDVGALHRFGSLSIEEALRFLRIENDGSTRVSNENFWGGMVRLDYRMAGWPFGQGSDRTGAYLEAEAWRDRDFVAPLGAGLHEIDCAQVRGHVIASRWLVESIYEQQTIDDDQNFYEAQNTAALYWVPSGDSFSKDSWIFVGGLEHLKTNLNPKELLGIILSARLLAPYQDYSERGGVEFTLFVDPQGGSSGKRLEDAWHLTAKFEDGISHLLGGQNPEENKWFGLQFFGQNLSGKWGTEETLGSEFFIRIDY